MHRIYHLAFASIALSIVSGAAMAQSKGNGEGSLVKGSEGLKAADFRFEVVSIRPVAPGSPISGLNDRPTPNGFTSRLTLAQAILIAYAGDTLNWGLLKMLNRPDWIGDYYDVNARVSQSDTKAWQSQSSQHELLRSAMQAALAERWRLKIHWLPGEGPIYELVVGKHGARLKAAIPNSPPTGMKLPSGAVVVQNRVNGLEFKDCRGATMGDLAWILTTVAPTTPVRDRTGLSGHYDLKFEGEPLLPGEDPLDAYSIDHLGLRLKKATESRPVLVIDHLERPTVN